MVVGGPGAREHHEQVGDRCVGDEALLSRDHPIPIVTNGFGLQTRRVRSSTGLGQREGGDDVAGRYRLKPAALLLVGAEADQDLSGDSVVGAEHRPQRQRGVAQLHRQLDVLFEVEAKAAPLLGDRVSEQTHLLGLIAKIVGHPILVEDLLLARDHGGANEVPGLGQDLLEIFGLDLWRFSGGHWQTLLLGPLWHCSIGGPRWSLWVPGSTTDPI